MLTYTQWKLNRQIAYGVIGIVVGVLVIAGVICWKRTDAKARFRSFSAGLQRGMASLKEGWPRCLACWVS